MFLLAAIAGFSLLAVHAQDGFLSAAQVISSIECLGNLTVPAIADAALINATNYYSTVPDFITSVGDLNTATSAEISKMVTAAFFNGSEEELDTVCDRLTSFVLDTDVLTSTIQLQYDMLQKADPPVIDVVGESLSELGENVHALVVTVAKVSPACANGTATTNGTSTVMR